MTKPARDANIQTENRNFWLKRVNPWSQAQQRGSCVTRGRAEMGYGWPLFARARIIPFIFRRTHRPVRIDGTPTDAWGCDG